MSFRFCRPLCLLFATAGVLANAPHSFAQRPATSPPGPAPKANNSSSNRPRTPDGRPDFQGIWDFRTVTPLERPGNFAGKEQLTADEAAAIEKQAVESRVDRPPRAGDPGTYNQFWFDFGTKVVGTKRTSLIVDPPDGRLPALTPEAQRRMTVRAEETRRAPTGPEDRTLWERCILGFNAGPPIMPSGYNNNIQLFQTPKNVVILTEMVHDARVVPLDGRPHGTIPQWMGDSRGHWEGDTLVVDTIQFTPKGTGTIGLRSASDEHLHLIERFTLADADTLVYKFTVDDPTVWARPWTAEVPMRRSPDQIYEYACHEGNYAMPGLLRGARRAEGVAVFEKK